VKNSAPPVLALALIACGGSSGPEELALGRDLCASCRMPVSDLHFAAQIITPGELPRFFDDPGCLADFVRSGQVKEKNAVAWVTDHRTGNWVRAEHAIYTLVPGLTSPMNHHLIAHESEASRDEDPAAQGGRRVSLQELFGPSGLPGQGAS